MRHVLGSTWCWWVATVGTWRLLVMSFACLNRRRRVAEVVTLSTDGVLTLSLRAWERDGVGTWSKHFSRVFPQTVASSHPTTSSCRSPFPLRSAALSFHGLMIISQASPTQGRVYAGGDQVGAPASGVLHCLLHPLFSVFISFSLVNCWHLTAES